MIIGSISLLNCYCGIRGIPYPERLSKDKVYNEILIEVLNAQQVNTRFEASLISYFSLLEEHEFKQTQYDESQLRIIQQFKESKTNRFSVKYSIGLLNEAYGSAWQNLGTLSISGRSYSLKSGDCNSDLSRCQAVVDNKTVVLLHYPEQNGFGAIGDPNRTAVGADHNTQSGILFGNAEIGTKIYFDLSYGQFIYQVEFGEHATLVNGQILNDEGVNVVKESYYNSYSGYLIFYTCYPFDASVTNERWIVYARLIEGTKLE